MTYWSREHERNLVTLRDVVRTLDAQRDILDNLRRELKADDDWETANARVLLLDARNGLSTACDRLENVPALLPEPRSESELTEAFKQIAPDPSDRSD